MLAKNQQTVPVLRGKFHLLKHRIVPLLTSYSEFNHAHQGDNNKQAAAGCDDHFSVAAGRDQRRRNRGSDETAKTGGECVKK